LPAVLRSLALVPASLALLFAACGDADRPQAARAPTSAPPEAEVTESDGDLDANGCTPATWDGAKDATFEAPGEKLDPAKTYVATVTTNCGDFEITLDAKRAPKTGGSFKFLADQRFYDGVLIHRVVPRFVFQGGDPEGTGSGGPGYSVVEEPPGDLVYEKGVVAMAKTGAAKPGSSGSQFFVVTGEDARELEPEYALLGRITGGEPVVEKIGAIITDPRTDLPDPPVVIETIRVTGSG
jgi:cyclophilin family peptidyl-prolyl cis-trans isomerase